MIEPILDHQFHERSFGFRHGRGAHDALRIVEQKLQEGYVYVVDADLKGYFDTIPKDRLLLLIQEQISDSRMLKLIKMFLDYGLQVWTFWQDMEQVRPNYPSRHETLINNASAAVVWNQQAYDCAADDGGAGLFVGRFTDDEE